jgi:acyl-CoA synthetase (AMP-forming)/AMP-acid ligase II
MLRRCEKGEIQVSGYSIMKGYWNGEADTAKVLVSDQQMQLPGSLLPAQGHDAKEEVWLRTGDEGLIEHDGTIRITGRIKDIIIRGGENIYPPEVEDCLLGYDHVKNASVVGLYDDKYGECIAAFLVVEDQVSLSLNENDQQFNADLRTGPRAAGADSYHHHADMIRSWIRERLSGLLVPKYIFWISELPLTVSGKVEKYKLQATGNSWLKSQGILP